MVGRYANGRVNSSQTDQVNTVQKVSMALAKLFKVSLKEFVLNRRKNLCLKVIGK